MKGLANDSLNLVAVVAKSEEPNSTTRLPLTDILGHERQPQNLKLTEVKTAVKGATFTCSTCAQLLAEQPTADEVSHAHMHTLDPFSVDVGKIKPASFKAPSTLDLTDYQSQRKGFWENPETHLNPINTGPYATSSIDPTTTTDKLSPLNLYMDKDRLAVNDTYLKRGMADVPEKIHGHRRAQANR